MMVPDDAYENLRALLHDLGVEVDTQTIEEKQGLLWMSEQGLERCEWLAGLLKRVAWAQKR